MKWLHSITDSMDMNLSKLKESGEQRSLACHSPLSLKKLDRTQQVNNNSMMNDIGESDHDSGPVDDGNREDASGVV